MLRLSILVLLPLLADTRDTGLSSCMQMAANGGAGIVSSEVRSECSAWLAEKGKRSADDSYDFVRFGRSASAAAGDDDIDQDFLRFGKRTAPGGHYDYLRFGKKRSPKYDYIRFGKRNMTTKHCQICN